MFGTGLHGVARSRGQTRPWQSGIGSRSTSRWSSQVAPVAVICWPRSRSERLASTNVGRGSSGPTEAPHLDDAADRRRMLEGLDPAEADMVGATVRSVDHGIGLAGQFVMQSPVDQPADDLATPAVHLSMT